MRRLPIFLLSIILFAALAACVIWWEQRADMRLITATVERGDIVTTMTTTGQLNAVKTVKVGSQQSGQIAELLVDFNDHVRKDQAIARLDPSAFSARVREAEAAVEEARATVVMEQAALVKARVDLFTVRTQQDVVSAQAESAGVVAESTRRDLKRKQVLVQKSTIAPAAAEDASAAYRSASALLRAAKAEHQVAESAVPAAEATLSMAEAALQHAHAIVKQRVALLEQAQIDLARTVIRSPINGVVIARSVDPGQTVAATLEAPTLFTIAQDLRQMEVHAKIDEADMGLIRVGQRANFTVDAHPDRIFGATVSQLRKAPEVTENVVTYTVVLTADNEDLNLLPGMTAMIEIVVDSAAGVLKIPNAAIRFDPAAGPLVEEAPAAGSSSPAHTATAWVKGEEDEPRPVHIEIGRSDGSSTELVSGSLHAGDEVIVGEEAAQNRTAWLGFRWK